MKKQTKQMKQTAGEVSAPQQMTIAARGGRVVYLPSLHPALSDAQLTAALASMPDDDVRWRAVNQIVDLGFAQAVLDVSNPRQSAEERASASGRQAAYLEIRDDLGRRRDAGRKGGAR